MIEIVADRIIMNLKSELPYFIGKINDYWKDSDIQNFKKQLLIKAPVDSNYLLGEPGYMEGTNELPQIYIIPLGFKYDGELNVNKNNAQFSRLYYKIMLFVDSNARMEKDPLLQRILVRMTDAVLFTLRSCFNLTDNDNKNPLVLMEGISSVKYNKFLQQEGRYIKSSEFELSYKITDSYLNGYMFNF